MKVNKNKKYPVLEEELQKKKTIHVPLKYVDETKAKEIEEKIEKEQTETKKEKVLLDPFRFAGYDPSIIDFIRRCDTDEQAKEIIDFMVNKGELATEEANKIRKQLANEGLRSFGTKKEKGYYFRS